MSEVTLYAYPFRGEGVKFDHSEVLGRSWGLTVGPMSPLAISGKVSRERRAGHI